MNKPKKDFLLSDEQFAKEVKFAKIRTAQAKNLIVKPRRFKPKMPIVKPSDNAVGSGSFVKKR